MSLKLSVHLAFIAHLTLDSPCVKWSMATYGIYNMVVATIL